MPLITVLGHGNQQHGFFYASIILSVISMPLFFITFKNCKEVITPTKEERPSLMDSLKAVGTNKPLMLIMITLLVVLMGLWGRLGTLTYYAIYVLHRPDLIAVFFTALSVTGAIGAIFLPYVSKYFEKKTIMIVGTLLSGLAFIAIYFIPATNITTVIVLSILSGIPFSFASPLTFSMIADCIDEHQVKTGVRADGAIYAFTSFSTKLASALVGALSGVALSAIGYVANKPQTAEALNGINVIVNLIPGILFIVAMIPLCFYQISKARATQNTEELLRRRSNFLS
jgi:GPH family glycoside/pentoside/hexuronide:cation symporter/probable glucitol transport protein GutA